MTAPGTPPQPPAKKKTSPWIFVLVGCGVVLLLGALVTAGTLWWGYHKAKDYVEKEAGGDSMKIAELWPDVPRMKGTEGSEQVDMPVALKLVARAFLDTMMKGLNDGKDAGHWDWTGLSLKGKSPADVEAYYTPERMMKNGWKSEGGCTSMQADMNSKPTLCAFQKQEGNRTTGLLIIAANDQEQNATSVFYIRQEAVAEQSPTAPTK